MQIRPIQPEDNPFVATLIREVLIEHNVPKVGTAYADVSLDFMYETYNEPGAAYFVIFSDSKIIGGAGVASLANGPDGVCELQKMYFAPEARAKGLGSQMMQECLDAARKLGYDKCYLETMPYMKAAQQLYLRSGFEYIDAPMGDTGHSSCPVWMLKDLKV